MRKRKGIKEFFRRDPDVRNAVQQLSNTKTGALCQARKSKHRRGGREAEGGGLPILPDLFVLIDFHLFCLS
jgi:hypothetical protein